MHPSQRPAGPSRRPTRKQYATLLEILIAISVLVIAAGIAAIGIRQAVREQKFRTETYEVLTTLRLAQQIMLVLNTDVHVKFKIDDGKAFTYKIELDDKLDSYLKKALTKPRPPLTEIHAINFNDGLGGGSKKNEIDIKFLSGGSVISQGVMRLGIGPPGTPNTQEAYICLPGFPHFFKTASSPTDDAACDVNKQKKFDQAVTQMTVAEVNEKNRVYKDQEGDNSNGSSSKEKK